MKKIFSIVVILSFLLSSCGQQTSTPQPVPVAPLETDVPFVTGQSPMEGERLLLNPTITLIFDRDMDQEKTTSAFEFTAADGIAVVGTISWPDSRTLVYKPDLQLDPASKYILVLKTNAASAQGAAIPEEYRREFQTVESLSVGQVFPAPDTGDVDLSTTITVIFNRPVVPLNISEEQSALPQPLTIQPEVRGTGEWVNSSVYVFQPEAILASGTDYMVSVDAGLTDSLGMPLEESFVWKFTTRAPRIDTFSLKNGETNPKMDIENVLLDQAFVVTFFQPMDRESTEHAISLLNRETGKAVAISTKWNDDSTILTIEPINRYKISGFYELNLTTSSLAQDGSPLLDGLTFRFSTVPLPRIESVNPIPNSIQTFFDPWMTIRFSSPMDFDTLKNHIKITPTPSTPVNYYYNEYDWELNIIGFDPSTEYIVRITQGMADIYGNRIQSDLSFKFTTGEKYPSANLAIPQTLIFRANGPQTFFFQHTNLDSARIELYELEADEFIRLLSNEMPYQDFNPRVESIRSWIPNLSVDPNLQVTEEFDLKDENGRPLAPGYYFLGVNAQPFEYSSRFFQGAPIIIATDNITLKSSDTEALAWLTDLETGEPMKNTDILFYNVQGIQVGKAKTDKDGLAYAKDIEHPIYARTEDSDRLAFAAQSWGSGVSSWDFGIQQDYWTPVKSPFAYIYTDRPIYRPNQDVFFKGIFRHNDDLQYSLPEESSVFVTIDFEGEPVYEKDLSINEMGTFADVLHLGEDVTLGTYGISIKLNKSDESPFAYGSFRVAEYRKPEFEMRIIPGASDVIAGSNYKFDVNATYYSGGPVGGADLNWFITASSEDFQPTQVYSSYSFSDYDIDDFNGSSSAGSSILDEGSGKLDGGGYFGLSNTGSLGKYKNGSRLTFSANATDVGGNIVGGSASIHVHPSLIYAGIRSQSYIGMEGQPSVFDLVVLDWNSDPIKNQEITVDIVRREWYSVQEKDKQGTLRWVTTSKDIPIEKGLTAVTDENGLANISFIPPTGGVYKAIVKVVDEKGNKQQSSRFIWVSGKEYIPWQQTNNRSFRLVADKETYPAGATAKILIAQPFEGENYALVTIERGHIQKQEVILLSGNSTIYELKIGKEMAPVVYVSVVVIKAADEKSAPDFKVGMTRIGVELDQQALDVSIKSDKEAAGPNDKVNYTIFVQDFAGNPVQAEISLALVDKAVLALAPDNSSPILSTFYPERALSVLTSLGIVLSADDFNENFRKSINDGLGGGSGGGGKGEGDLGVMTIRQNFRDTAYYEAQVETDRNGKATVTVTLPENLTTWQMKVRAVTKDSLVGEATHELVSNKPLYINLQTPRFLIVDDAVRVGATIHNNTDVDLSVKVSLKAEGVEIRSAVEQTVTVSAGKQEYITWDVIAGSGVERADFTVSAESGKYQDTSKPAGASLEGQGIPVYTFHVSETVGTSGVLRDATSITEAIQLPRTTSFKDATVNVELSPSLAASSLGGLNSLNDFEYLCMEQTISRFLPNLAAVRALDLAGQPSPELRAKLDRQINTALQRIYARQLYDGGWNWWDGDMSDLNVSAYVMLGLLEAKLAGYSISTGIYEKGLEYLQTNLNGLEPNDAEWLFNRNAFVTYVLARAGDFPATIAQNLYENRIHLGNYGKGYLAQAYHLNNSESTRVKEIISDLASSAIVSSGGNHWEEKEPDFWNWNTDLRTTAIVLDTFIRIQPESPLTVNAVRWLMAHRRKDGWGSTQETAWTLIALTDWLEVSREFDANYSYAVGMNGKLLVQGSVTEQNLTTPVPVAITSEDLNSKVNYLVIAKGAGAGSLYYTAQLVAELPVASIKAIDRGISISRQYFKLDDSKTPITEIKRGDLVRVRVTIVAPAALHYVVINDPLPAGLEAIDASLQTDVQVPQKYGMVDFARRGWGWWFFTHVELRDEKVVLSADHLPAGTYVYTYLARAGTAGTFNVIPTTAAEFYFPDVYGRGEGSVFIVTP